MIMIISDLFCAGDTVGKNELALRNTDIAVLGEVLAFKKTGT